MSNTKKHPRFRKSKRHGSSSSKSSKNCRELYNKNKKRINIIRNIRMGRSTFNRLGGGRGVKSSNYFVRKDGNKLCEQTGGGGMGGGISQFIGLPWSASGNANTGNYFNQSALGVGTGIVPNNDDGRALNHGERYPTQYGAQLPKLGEMRGGKRKSMKMYSRGGGFLTDIQNAYGGITSNISDFNSKLQGLKPAPSSYAWDQPIASKQV